jgi:ribosomal protein L40E
MAETLICERCHGDNPVDARFCIDCGAALVNAATGPTTRLKGISCPACQTQNPEHARFCVVCGRSLEAGPAQQRTPQPQPRPQPTRPAAPRVASRPTQQSYPRMATPPILAPVRPTPSHMPHARPQAANPAPFIFLIGLVVLLANGAVWPGILVLIGVSILISQVARGRPDKGMSALFWFGGITLLLATGAFWPGIFVLLLLNAALNGWGRSHHRHW